MFDGYSSEALRSIIVQPHVPSNGNGIFAISRNSAQLGTPCENVPAISSILSDFLT